MKTRQAITISTMLAALILCIGWCWHVSTIAIAAGDYVSVVFIWVLMQAPIMSLGGLIYGSYRILCVVYPEGIHTAGSHDIQPDWYQLFRLWREAESQFRSAMASGFPCTQSRS